MPQFDKTGPFGQGPRTGCGQGRCNFFGLRRGAARIGRRLFGFSGASSCEDRLTFLTEEEALLGKELASIRQELERLKKEQSEL